MPFPDREQEQLPGRPGVLLSQRLVSSARSHDPVSWPRLRAICGHDRHPRSVTGKGGFFLGLQVPGRDLFMLSGVSCSYCFSLNPNVI
jgi:hypothetical protein